jgi:LysM repeat protein
VHEDEQRVAALDPGPFSEPSGVADLTGDEAWPFPTAAAVALSRSVAPAGSCRYLHLQSGAANCLAIAPTIAVSSRQVELMCLGQDHVYCPRFVHGGTGERPLPPPILRPSAVAVLPAVRPAPGGASTAEASIAARSTAVASSAIASTAPSWAPFAADGEEAPDGDAPADLNLAPAVVAGGAAVVASRATADVAASDEPFASAEIAGRPVPYEPPPDDRWAVDVPGAAERSLPDAASDTEGLAGLVAATPDDDAVDDAAAAGALSAAASAEHSSDVSADAPAGDAVAAPIAVPRRGRLRSDRLRMSQAHERSIALRRSTIAASLVLVAAIVVALAFVAARGGLVLPEAGSPAPSLVAVASGAVASTAPPTASTAPPTASNNPTASGAGPSTAPPTASHAPTASATPGGFTTAQLAVLKPCPGKTSCWQYRIHPGDNLHGVAKFFGVAYATLLKANPQITNPSLIHVGEAITIPPPS